MSKTGALILLTLSCLSQSKKLPDYINPCRVKDPNLGECIGVSANEMLSTFVKEHEFFFKRPSLSPFDVKLTASPEKTFTFELRGKAVGLEGTRFKSSKFDIKKIEERAILHFPKIVVSGPYKIEGRIRGKRIEKSSGVATITFDDVLLNYIWPFALYKKNEVDHMKTLNTSYTYEIKHSSVSEENKGQAADASKLLSENWKEIAKDVEPSLTKTIHDLVTVSINAVVAYSSFSEIFSQ